MADAGLPTSAEEIMDEADRDDDASDGDTYSESESDGYSDDSAAY